MTIKERLAIIETDIKYIRKMLYVLMVAVLGTAGWQII